MADPSHPLDIRMSADGKYIKYIEIYMFTPEVWPRTVKMDILDEWNVIALPRMGNVSQKFH